MLFQKSTTLLTMRYKNKPAGTHENSRLFKNRFFSAFFGKIQKNKRQKIDRNRPGMVWYGIVGFNVPIDTL